MNKHPPHCPMQKHTHSMGRKWGRNGEFYHANSLIIKQKVFNFFCRKKWGIFKTSREQNDNNDDQVICTMPPKLID